MTARLPLLVCALVLAAACGDSGATTSAAGGDAVSTTTVAPPVTTVPEPVSTLATTTTTRPPPEFPDAAAAGDCGELVDAALAATQVMLDELSQLTLADLAALEDDVPPALAEMEEFGAALEARAAELECDDAEMEAALFGRVDELTASGELAELILDGLRDEATRPTDAAPGEPPEGVEFFDVADATHTEDPVAYDQDPPVGGPHHPVWQNCGFYSEPVVTEHAVHSLEHGAVWITYTADFAVDVELEALRALAAEPHVLVSPYDGLGDTPVVASVWGAQMRFESALDPDLRRFLDTLREQTAPEPGAPCDGGVGEPE